jgi:hypothetical protein
MSSSGKLYTLELCSRQLLASEIHNNFNLKKKIAKNNYSPPYFYLPTWENLHRLVNLHIWRKISSLSGYRCLYSKRRSDISEVDIT